MKLTNTDMDLWEKMRRDDAGAFEEIYNRYAENMFIYAMNIFKKQDVCEDIVQNIFIGFWSKRRDVEIKNLKSYLFQSVKFQVFKHLRDRKMNVEELTRLQIVDATMDVSRKLEFEELENLIHELITHLTPRCREIFIMSRYQNKSNAEIAETLKISKQAVKNQISKALKQLREELPPQELILYFVSLYLLVPVLAQGFM